MPPLCPSSKVFTKRHETIYDYGDDPATRYYFFECPYCEYKMMGSSYSIL